MRDSPNSDTARADTARALIASLLQELMVISAGLQHDDDTPAVRQRFERWQERAARRLSEAVAPAEGERFSRENGAVVIMGDPVGNFLRQLDWNMGHLRALDEAITADPSIIFDVQPGLPPAHVRQGQPRQHRQVFVVHGHHAASREQVARFVERLGLEAVVLHEQASGGRTIIEKLEHYSDVDFAIVLLTPDDVGAVASNRVDLRARARQNVVMELGYFIGKLGRERVCALQAGAVELPSDILGVVYVPLDEGGAWRYAVAKELRGAGYTVDLNKL